MRRAQLGVVTCVLSAAAVAACGGPRNASSPAQSPASFAAAGASACSAPSNARPLEANGASGALVLARIGGRKVALVADEDAKAILTVDVDTREAIAMTPLGSRPGQLHVAGDGRVFVTLRETSEVAVLTAERAEAPLVGRCKAGAPSEPIALAATPDGHTLLVTAGWGQKLVAYDTSTLGKRFEVKLPREPRSVVVSDDGKTAFVSHAVGARMSVVDLGARTAGELPLRGYEVDERRELATRRALPVAPDAKPLGRPTCQGFALAKSAAVPGRIFAPAVAVDPGDPERRPDGYGNENEETETPSIAVLDEDARTPLLSSVTLGRDATLAHRNGRDGRDPRPGCLLPRAAVVDAKTRSLLVTCFGIDAVVAYDAASGNPLAAERRRWPVGSGPTGIAVDAEKHRAVVWSQFDRTITTFPIGGTEVGDDHAQTPFVQRTALAPLPEKIPSEIALGRILFHAAGDARIASDGRACASCHPDGRDDAITWATPEGPRRSINLAGRVTRTAPYSWNGNETTLHNHLGNTFDRLSGKGLRSIELDALVAYLSTMPAPTPEAVDPAKAGRGQQIFASAEAGCASCHSGANASDGQNHDVGSKHRFDRAASFNTPSLHLVGGAGPYFHDGRYGTLTELLTKSDGKMGRTAHLSPADLDALETYLRTL